VAISHNPIPSPSTGEGQGEGENHPIDKHGRIIDSELPKGHPLPLFPGSRSG